MKYDRYKQRKKAAKIDSLLSDLCRIQTCNLLIRSQMLYSVELTDPFANPLDGIQIVIRTGFKPVTF